MRYLNAKSLAAVVMLAGAAVAHTASAAAPNAPVVSSTSSGVHTFILHPAGPR